MHTYVNSDQSKDLAYEYLHLKISLEIFSLGQKETKD